jgi:hypothetical protein
VQRSELAVLLKSLHWSPERLAREINRRYGRGTVSLKAPYGWTKGAFPRGQVSEFVAIVLSEHLGRVIVVSQIWPEHESPVPVGFDDPGLGPPWRGEHVDRILAPLVEQDVGIPDGTAPSPGEPVPGSVLVSLAVGWLTAEVHPGSARTEGVELTAEILDVFTDRIGRLPTLGITRNRSLALNLVVHELRWALQLAAKTAYDVPSGRRLYRAIAELAQLAGWLAEEQDQYARAQRYLLGALRASALADDRCLGGRVLSCLGYHLAKYGNEREALRLLKLVDFGTDDGAPRVLPSPPSCDATRLHGLNEQLRRQFPTLKAAGGVRRGGAPSRGDRSEGERPSPVRPEPVGQGRGRTA